jgi:photoactive yellow protein
MSTRVSAFDLDKALHLSGDELDQLPFGVIVVDRGGVILEYNQYERDLAHMGTRAVIGKNFFTDIAPCTAIRTFQGRFGDWLKSNETSIEPFEFIFKFPNDTQRVNVIFARLSADADRATICVLRSEVKEESHTT